MTIKQMQKEYPDAYEYVRSIKVRHMKPHQRRVRYPYTIVKLSGHRFLFYKEGQDMPEIVPMEE